MIEMPSNDIRRKTPQAAGASEDRIHDMTVRADVLALLTDPESVQLCLDIAEDAARAINGTLAAAHVGADPQTMVAAAEEIDLQLLRDHDEGSPLQRFDHVLHVFKDWTQARPGREALRLDDCRGDLGRCVTAECRATALVVTSCHGNMDARDTFHDVLFNDRKLVLVPPTGSSAGKLLGHVLIGWKPHDHARRAVVAARRWLAAADRITVVCVNDRPDRHYRLTARALLEQLGLDGEVVAVRSGSRSVGETILDVAQTEQATCLLVGAFKHGYLLDLLIGRVTRHLLAHARLPMMMKH